MDVEEFRKLKSGIPDDELIKMADKTLSKLCKTGARSFTMSVPPRLDDTDMIFGEIIDRFKQAIQVEAKVMPNEVVAGDIENERDDFSWIIEECKRLEPKAFELVKGFAHPSISRATLFAALVDYAKVSQREA